MIDSCYSAPDKVTAPIDADLQVNDVRPDAFDQRQALMPMWGMSRIEPQHWPQIWQQVQASALVDDSLAYIHIPFCASRCYFCGFYRNLWREERGAPYVDRLISEMAQEAEQRPSGGSIRALYLGGGTPTALSGEQLARILQAARQYLPLEPDCEITIEGRISHFDQDKWQACLDAGATRFSIGVQSFDRQLRTRLGRKHPGDEAAAYLRRMREASDAVIVADLLFGLPGQDDVMWAQDIEVALSLGLSGLDIYAFNCYPDLPVARMIQTGRLPALPELAVQAKQYAYACRRLQAAGWIQLSNSHFARPGGGERNLYNRAIKSGHDCLAFGSGAGGCRAGFSYMVEPDLARYQATASTQKPLGMLAGVSPFKQSFGQLQGALEDGYLPLALLQSNAPALLRVESWRQQGLLDVVDGVAQLTIAGRFWAPMLIRELAMMIANPMEKVCPQSHPVTITRH
jgi:putative heme utilization radical SAM enzyme HutW